MTRTQSLVRGLWRRFIYARYVSLERFDQEHRAYVAAESRCSALREWIENKRHAASDRPNYDRMAREAWDYAVSCVPHKPRPATALVEDKATSVEATLRIRAEERADRAEAERDAMARVVKDRERLWAAVVSIWTHTEKHTTYVEGLGYCWQTGDPPCPDPDEHKRLAAEEGAAWNEYETNIAPPPSYDICGCVPLVIPEPSAPQGTPDPTSDNRSASGGGLKCAHPDCAESPCPHTDCDCPLCDPAAYVPDRSPDARTGVQE